MFIAKSRLAGQKHVIHIHILHIPLLGFARNTDTVGYLSSPFFTHVIQIYVTRGRNSLTCKATFRIFLLVSSMHATCFGCADHPQALKHMTIKLKMVCVCLLYYFIVVSMSYILMSDYGLDYQLV